MAEKSDVLSVTESDVSELPELDQPDDLGTVSLDDVRAKEVPEGADGEIATGEARTEGDADPQPNEAQDHPISQAEFDRIFGERARGLRRQFQKEHGDELALAELVRGAYPGMTREAIEDALLTQQAHALAEQTGWDEEEAKQKIVARRAFDRYGHAGEAPELPDPHVALLQRQLSEIKDSKGIDMLEIIDRDAFLTEQVNAGKMDIKDAYIYHMENNQAAAPVRKVARVEKRAGAASSRLGRELSDGDIDRIDRALQSGRRVRLD